MGQYLMDSNAVIDFLTASYPQKGMSFMVGVVNENINISVITKMEVLGFNTSAEDHRKLSNFISHANMHELNDEVVEETIELRKQHRIKLPDAIIAATCIVNKLTLITNNTRD